MSLYGFIYTDSQTSLVQNTDAEEQLETVPSDPVITAGRNFPVSQGSIFSLAL